jgi:hypothetical protein
MELGLNNSSAPHIAPRCPTRLERAQWWFARIRQAVDAAALTRPEPEARPLQERLDIAA